MHTKLLVTTNKRNAKTSIEAINYVESILGEDQSFCGEGGRFSSPVCDWFSMGGGWSGELTRATLDQKKLKEFWKEFEKQGLGWTNNTDKKEESQKKKSYALFKKYFPKFKGIPPIYRNQYLGKHNDDAIILTKKIYDVLLKNYEDKSEWGVVKDEDGILRFVDLEEDEPEPSFVDNKWIVVVDYHW